MARASFRFGQKEKKPTFSMSFLDREDEQSPFSARIRSGLSRSFEPVYDGMNTSAFIPEEAQQKQIDFPAMRAFREHMSSVPDQAEYAPGIGRKIGAALVGFASGLKDPSAGAQTTRAILDAPFINAYRNWATQAQGLQAAAENEQEQIQQQIRIASQDLNERRLYYDQQNRIASQDLNERKFDYEQQKDRIEQELKIQDMKAKGWETTRADGRVIMINPVTNEKLDLGVDMDAKLREDSNRISAYSAETGRINAGINQQNAKTNERNVESLIDARKFGTMISADRANTYRDIARQRGENQAKTKNVPLREQILAEQEAALDITLTNPEYKKFIDKDGSIKRPGSIAALFGGGFDEAELQKFLELVELKKWDIINRKYGNGPTQEVELDFSSLPPG
jgi:hypothetical protein